MRNLATLARWILSWRLRALVLAALVTGLVLVQMNVLPHDAMLLFIVGLFIFVIAAFSELRAMSAPDALTPKERRRRALRLIDEPQTLDARLYRFISTPYRAATALAVAGTFVLALLDVEPSTSVRLAQAGSMALLFDFLRDAVDVRAVKFRRDARRKRREERRRQRATARAMKADR